MKKYYMEIEDSCKNIRWANNYNDDYQMRGLLSFYGQG